MPTGHTIPLPLRTWDRDTLRAVALAYRRVCRLGERDLTARGRGRGRGPGRCRRTKSRRASDVRCDSVRDQGDGHGVRGGTRKRLPQHALKLLLAALGSDTLTVSKPVRFSIRMPFVA